MSQHKCTAPAIIEVATSDPAVLLPGAVLVGATITGLQLVSQVYLPSRMGRASELVLTVRMW